MPGSAALPASVLFVCTHNAIRSPMAAELMRRRFGPLIQVDSAGVRPIDEVNYMAAAVIDELGGDISTWRPKGFAWFVDNETPPFDLVISLTPEAHHRVLDLIPTLGRRRSTGPPSTPP